MIFPESGGDFWQVSHVKFCAQTMQSFELSEFLGFHLVQELPAVLSSHRSHECSLLYHG